MSPRTNGIFVVVTLSLLIGTLLFTLRERAARHYAEATLKKTAQDQFVAEIESIQAKEKLRILEVREAELRTRISSLVPPKAAVLPPLTPNFQETVDNDARLQVLSFKAQRAALDAIYAPLFRKLSLSPAEIQAVEDLMVQRREQQNDIMATIRKQGLSMSDPAVSKLLSDARTEYAKVQAALLGAEGYQQLREFDRTSTLREMVSGIAGSATVAGAPLASAQAERLVQLMAASTAEYPNKESDINPASIDWEMVDAQAKEILSPEQFVAFQTLEGQGLTYNFSRQMDRLNELITKAAKAEKRAPIIAASPPG
jgi:hypothetical protein